jgi:hypothetical protein
MRFSLTQEVAQVFKLSSVNRIAPTSQKFRMDASSRFGRCGSATAAFMPSLRLRIPSRVQRRPGRTIQKEKAILARWTDYLGQLRIDQIKRVHVNRFIEARLKEKVSPRTINLDVIALRVVLKRALEDGQIQRLPTKGLRPLKTANLSVDCSRRMIWKMSVRQQRGNAKRKMAQSCRLPKMRSNLLITLNFQFTRSSAKRGPGHALGRHRF